MHGEGHRRGSRPLSPLSNGPGQGEELPYLTPGQPHARRRRSSRFAAACGGFGLAARPCVANGERTSDGVFIGSRARRFHTEENDEEPVLPVCRERSMPLSARNPKGSAELFYYMNRTAYNGLCRFNSRGEFNAPFGQYKTIAYAKSFEMYRDVFADWRFTSGDFADIELRSDKDDFVYADPPYDVEFTAYSRKALGTSGSSRRGPSHLHRPCGPRQPSSPHQDELHRKLGTPGYHDAPRRISCTGDRTPAKEVFATRNL